MSLDIPVEIQKTIEIVDIFRPSNLVPDIIEQAIQLKKNHSLPNVIWMQLGIIHYAAARKAKNHGFAVVMNKCIRIEYAKLKKKK